MSSFFLKLLTFSALLILVLILLSAILYTVKKPSNAKAWSLGNGRTATVAFDNDAVTIHNFRHADWRHIDTTATTQLIHDANLFTTLQFKLSDIQSLKAVVSHFAPLSEIAHIFILFELSDGRVIGLSVEARKEQGEEYSLYGGLTAKFELIYLLASYQDLVGIRLMREESVYIYPIKATPEESQALFKVAATRVNQLAQTPELYHLFVKNCTTEIVKLVNKIADKKFSRITQSFMPGDAGRALFKMDLIDTDLTSFEQVQQAFLVKE